MNIVTKELWSKSSSGCKMEYTGIERRVSVWLYRSEKNILSECLTGQTAWIDNTVNSDFATIVDCGNVIIGLASTENLIVMKPESAAYSEIENTKYLKQPIYAYPVVAGIRSI